MVRLGDFFFLPDFDDRAALVQLGREGEKETRFVVLLYLCAFTLTLFDGCHWIYVFHCLL